MQASSHSAASARAAGEEIPPSLSESAPSLVRAICQVVIGELLVKVQAELNLVREHVDKLHTNITKVPDPISVWLKGIENTMPSAVVSEEVSQPQTNVSVIIEGRNALSNEMDLRIFRVADRLTNMAQNPVSAFTPASTP